MPKIFKEPLVQFLVGGFILYLTLAAFGDTQDENDPYTIPVNDESLLLYLQYQDKAFDTKSAKTKLEALSNEDRQRLEAEYIRDEVMVREAVAFGLNNNDEVIRRRLIQKMDFIISAAPPTAESITAEEVETYFNNNRDTLVIEGTATFTHIFFSKEKHGQAEATRKAEALLPALKDQNIPFEEAGKFGDRFYYLRNYVRRSQKVIENHFGNEMSFAVFGLNTKNEWFGPIESSYGSHLIFVRDVIAQRQATLSEATPQILDQLIRSQADEQRASAVAKLLTKYKIKYTSLQD